MFLLLYLSFSLVVLPILAPIFGRTSLPLWGNLKPLNFGTCLLNRHYVTPQLKSQMENLGDEMSNMFPGTKTNYLDANFPFFDGFPLLPHLSHNDGKKLDLAFYYIDGTTGNPSSSAPSVIGYGVYEDPRVGEVNTAEVCRQGGYWQYELIGKIVPQWKKEKFNIDETRTSALIKLLAESEVTSKVFIEPHLKSRWGLSAYNKSRFHGCHAVRHDDHIHTQVN